MTDVIDLGADLETLAHQMLLDAAKPDVALTQRLDVFKILSAHYVSLRKVKGREPGLPGDGPTMDGLRNQINGTAETQGDGENEQT